MANLNFLELNLPDKITKTFDVTSKSNDSYLGIVKWYAPWRRYCFVSRIQDAIFDRNCLQEIVDFIDQLMAARKT